MSTQKRQIACFKLFPDQELAVQSYKSKIKTFKGKKTPIKTNFTYTAMVLKGLVRAIKP